MDSECQGVQTPSLKPVAVAMITMNEEAAIAKVIHDIRRHLPGAEIVVVDSSRDETPTIARGLGCHVVRQFPPEGYGRAMDRALREAAARAEVVLTLDCDDTYPVEDAEGFLRKIQAGADLVDGNRIWQRPKAMPLPNYWANVAFGLVAKILCGGVTQDLHSGMRAYRKTMLDNLTWDPSGPALPVELVLRPQRLGYKVIEVPILYRERIGTTTLHRWSSTWWTFKRIWRMARLPRTTRGES